MSLNDLSTLPNTLPKPFFIPSNALACPNIAQSTIACLVIFHGGPSRQLFICFLRGLIQSSSLRTKVRGGPAIWPNINQTGGTIYHRHFLSRFLFCQPKDQPFSFISCKLNETKQNIHWKITSPFISWWVVAGGRPNLAGS